MASTTEEPSKNKPLLIGITGPIGCGKSTIAGMLRELGGEVMDADVLARRATEAGRATLPEIRARFGHQVFAADGSLDRSALAELVFSDPSALEDLERIVHPDVRLMLSALLERATEDQAPFVVIEAIKLVEGGLAEQCDEVWLIECQPDVQEQRLAARGTSREEVTRRRATQGADLLDRLAATLAVGPSPKPRIRRVSTNGSLAETRELVEDALADAFEGGSGSS
jgi:dephospho-CoA kinase